MEQLGHSTDCAGEDAQAQDTVSIELANAGTGSAFPLSSECMKIFRRIWAEKYCPEEPKKNCTALQADIWKILHQTLELVTEIETQLKLLKEVDEEIRKVVVTMTNFTDALNKKKESILETQLEGLTDRELIKIPEHSPSLFEAGTFINDYVSTKYWQVNTKCETNEKKYRKAQKKQIKIDLYSKDLKEKLNKHLRDLNERIATFRAFLNENFPEISNEREYFMEKTVKQAKNVNVDVIFLLPRTYDGYIQVWNIYKRCEHRVQRHMDKMGQFFDQFDLDRQELVEIIEDIKTKKAPEYSDSVEDAIGEHNFYYRLFERFHRLIELRKMIYNSQKF